MKDNIFIDINEKEKIITLLNTLVIILVFVFCLSEYKRHSPIAKINVAFQVDKFERLLVWTEQDMIFPRSIMELWIIRVSYCKYKPVLRYFFTLMGHASSSVEFSYWNVLMSESTAFGVKK